MARLALLAVLICGSPVATSAQSIVFEPRVGVVFSGPLVEDSLVPVAGEEGREHNAPVRATPGAAPVMSLEIRSPSDGPLEMEAEAGVTFARLGGDDAATEWDIQDLRVAHAVLGARYQLAVFEARYQPPAFVHVRGGLGAIRYSSSSTGLFREGAELNGLLQGGVGATIPAGGHSVTFGASGQWHRFSTFAMRREGGRDGAVWRALLQIGVVFGAGRGEGEEP